MTTLSAAAAAPPDALAALAPQHLQVGYGVSLTDLSAFSQSLAGAAGRLEARAVSAPGEAMQALFRPLEQLNVEAKALSEFAQAAMTSGNTLTPGEIVMMTVRSHEFMFHSQLTANSANRLSDGLQQLFRQQS